MCVCGGGGGGEGLGWLTSDSKLGEGTENTFSTKKELMGVKHPSTSPSAGPEIESILIQISGNALSRHKI